MPKYQAFNKKINAWVMYELGKKGFSPLNVKQKMPAVPFKGVKIKGKKK